MNILQKKLEHYYILLSNGVDINDINSNLIKMGFRADDIVICKETKSKNLVKELLETLIHVYDYDSNSSSIRDANLYYTLDEYRSIKIDQLIKKN